MIKIKLILGHTFIINGAAVAYIDESTPNLIRELDGSYTYDKNGFTAKVHFIGGSIPILLHTHEWNKDWDTDELTDNDIDIAEYNRFLSELATV